MALDKAVLASLTRRFEPNDYLRCPPWAHRATPLGMGFGKTRFASPSDSFKLLYIAAIYQQPWLKPFSETGSRAPLTANSISMISARGAYARSMPPHRSESSIYARAAVSNLASQPTSLEPKRRPKPAYSARSFMTRPIWTASCITRGCASEIASPCMIGP